MSLLGSISKVRSIGKSSCLSWFPVFSNLIWFIREIIESNILQSEFSIIFCNYYSAIMT